MLPLDQKDCMPLTWISLQISPLEIFESQTTTLFAIEMCRPYSTLQVRVKSSSLRSNSHHFHQYRSPQHQTHLRSLRFRTHSPSAPAAQPYSEQSLPARATQKPVLSRPLTLSTTRPTPAPTLQPNLPTQPPRSASRYSSPPSCSQSLH